LILTGLGCYDIYYVGGLLWAGSEMVDWLYSHVEGFIDRRDARRYACNLLKAGMIHHTVNKLTFSEQCYYVFGNSVSKGLMSMTFLSCEVNTCICAFHMLMDCLPFLPFFHIDSG